MPRRETDSAIAVYKRYLATLDVVRSGDGADAIALAHIYRGLGELYELRGDRMNARDF